MTTSLTLRAVYPCCGGAAILKAHQVPREVHDRRCPTCRKPWTITRSLLSDRPGIRMDKIEWE